MIEHPAPRPPAPPLPTGPRWTASASGADRAEKRLRNALVELERRGERVIDEVRALAPGRTLAIVAIAGVGALFFLAAVRWAARPRRHRPRVSASRSVPRSLARELVTRAALGAAGVIGARLASDLIVPALSRSSSASTSEHDDEE